MTAGFCTLDDILDQIGYTDDLDELEGLFLEGMDKLDVDAMRGEDPEIIILRLAEQIRFVALVATRKKELAGEGS